MSKGFMPENVAVLNRMLDVVITWQIEISYYKIKSVWFLHVYFMERKMQVASF